MIEGKIGVEKPQIMNGRQKKERTNEWQKEN